jgi:hypothetical protein
MFRTIRMPLVLVLLSLAGIAATGCSAVEGDRTETAASKSTLVVTARDVAALPQGESLFVDVTERDVRFDPSAGRIDLSRVRVGASREESESVRDVLGVASSMSGKSVEEIEAQPFSLEGAEAPSSEISPKVWCPVRVWILPAHEDDIFRIGYVAVWKTHC